MGPEGLPVLFRTPKIWKTERILIFVYRERKIYTQRERKRERERERGERGRERERERVLCRPRFVVVH